MHTTLLSDHSFCNGRYKALPSVQTAPDGTYQGIVIVAALEEGAESTRHTVPGSFTTYQAAFDEAKRHAQTLIDMHCNWTSSAEREQGSGSSAA